MNDAVTNIVAIISAVVSVITAVGVIYSKWLDYNKKVHEEQKAYELEKQRKADLAQSKIDREHSQRIFGEIWRLMDDLGASRVFIIQPHPLSKPLTLSVYYEARDRGVMSIRNEYGSVAVADVAGFATELRTRDFIYLPTIEEMKDRRVLAIMRNMGVASLVCKRMFDEDGIWCGNIVATFPTEHPLEIPYVKGKMFSVANDIQYILPEIK